MTKNTTHQEENLRNIKLTNIVSISLTVIGLALGLVYFISSSVTNTSFHFTIWAITPFFMVPFLLNKMGFENLGRFLICAILPTIAIIVSIYNKMEYRSVDSINAVNFFDVRLIIINSSIIPFVLYGLREYRQLLISLAPSFCALILFDPIHNYFNVGFYQMGLISNDYYFSTNLYSCVTFIFISIVLLILKNQVLKSDQRQSSENAKIRLYLEALVTLGNSENINFGRVDKAKKEVLEIASKCLTISRVSVWEYDKKNRTIKCEYLMEKGILSTPNSELKASDYPNYFKAIESHQLIIAENAEQDTDTSEFTESYLKVLNIKSMMDAPYLNVGELGGVICCEHQNEYKSWGAAESILLKALGDFLSYSISIKERIKQNQLLTAQNSEISRINENLESVVKRRTEELEDKNKQLTEYAYINSHILRAPVARISGLYNLFQMKMDHDDEILGHMYNSIAELEEVTYQINRAIEENGSFNRSNLMN